ncbi:hypothetical protein BDC45DRAFT_564524 [Circinella umbellata]|nr:hypothetical protein BDC45DRAFT_564524 [Circinella umbellata]
MTESCNQKSKHLLHATQSTTIKFVAKQFEHINPMAIATSEKSVMYSSSPWYNTTSEVYVYALYLE